MIDMGLYHQYEYNSVKFLIFGCPIWNIKTKLIRNNLAYNYFDFVVLFVKILMSETLVRSR